MKAIKLALGNLFYMCQYICLHSKIFLCVIFEITHVQSCHPLLKKGADSRSRSFRKKGAPLPLHRTKRSSAPAPATLDKKELRSRSRYIGQKGAPLPPPLLI